MADDGHRPSGPAKPIVPIPKFLKTATGDTISYRQIGSPDLPGFIYLHGGFETWHNHIDLAKLLSPSYVVYLPDRRGRGLSSNQPPEQESGIATEAADLAALARHTGARLVGGLSAGAWVVLRALLDYRDLFDRAVLYEPPRRVDESKKNIIIPRMEEQIARDDVTGAVISVFKMVEEGPPLVASAPYWVGRPIVSVIMSWEDSWRKSEREIEDKEAEAAGIHVDQEVQAQLSQEPLGTMRNLCRVFPQDFRLVAEMKQLPLETFSALKDFKLLIMSGTASKPYLIQSAEDLEEGTGAPHVRFPGLDHLGTGCTQFGGRPDLIAETMKEFFTDSGRFSSKGNVMES